MKKRLFLVAILALAVVAGIVTAVCFLTDPVDKNPDDATQQTDPGDATEQTNPGDVTNQTADNFLKGEIFATDKDGRKVTIQDYVRGDYNKYALYDMSGDAVPELIIKTGNGLTIFSVKEQGLTVWYEGTTYEKPLNNRAIFYERPGGAPEHTRYQYIVLDHNGEELQRTSFMEIHGDNPEYFINGEKASKTAYEDLYKSFDLSDDKIVWKDIPSVDGANPNQEQQSQPAITFRVNSSSSEYTATVNYSNGSAVTAQSVTITDRAAKKDIQTISLSGNELFAEKALYTVDVTFDGNLDILIPYQQPSSAAYFQAYVWQESEGKFLYASQFENLPNFVIDQTNGRILSTRTASQITSYSINYYDAEAKDFRPSHAIYWEPDASSNKIHFVEQQYKDGTMVTVKDCLVEKTGNMDVNKSDPQIAEYFASNSFWDLDSQKWKSQFYKPSQNGTTEGTKTAAQAYTDFLNEYVTDTSVFYFTKDIDGNGTEELIVDQNTAMEVYTYQGTVKKVGAHDFITGTLLLHHTKDNKYPGIVYVTVGGGKNHFGYITITDGALSVRQTFDDDYGMISGKKEDVFYTDDEDLIAISRKAYKYNYQIGYSERKPNTQEDPYAIREITDGRVIAGEKNQTYKDSFVSLDFPLGWKCLEQWGEDGRFIYFQDPALGENCQLSIYFAGATIYTYDYTREDYMAHFSGYYGYKDVVIDSFAKETIQGFPCTKIAYSYTEDNIRFVGTRYDDLIEESRLYHITITYPAAESKTYEKEFAAIIESVRFLKSNQVDISSLPLKEAYDYAVKQYQENPEKHRDICDLQSETQEIIKISGQYYQSFVSSSADIRYIWISRSEFPDNRQPLWDWYPVGSSQVYSLDLLGKIDEGRNDNETTEKTYTFTDAGVTVHSTADKSAFSQPISCTYSGKTLTLTPHFTGIPVTAVYYSQNYWFNERGVWVNVSTDAGGRDFLVDKNGKIVADSYFQISTEVPVIPSTIGAEYSAGEGLYVYTDGTLYGLKNSAGTVITQPLYRRTLINFFGGYAVAERADGTFVAIDTTGKEYGTLPGGRSNGDKTFLEQEGEPGNYTQYLYDLQGNRISDGYDSISYFHDGLALIKKGNKLGLISADGTVVLEPCIECDVVTYPPKGRGFSYAFMDQNAFVIPIGGEIAVITVDK